NMELESFDDGVLTEVRVGENESAPVGAVIAVLNDGKSAKPTKDAPAKPAAPEPAAAPKAPPRAAAAAPTPPAEKSQPDKRRSSSVRRAEPGEPTAAQGPIKASPLARRLAEEHGLDLRGLTGTGPGGRIVERDVQAALGGGEDDAPAEAGRQGPV